MTHGGTKGFKHEDVTVLGIHGDDSDTEVSALAVTDGQDMTDSKSTRPERGDHCLWDPGGLPDRKAMIDMEKHQPDPSTSPFSLLITEKCSRLIG